MLGIFSTGGDCMDLLKLIKDHENEVSREKILEELYWTSLDLITKDEMTRYVRPFLIDSVTIKEYEAVQRLYSNPDGAHIDLFEDVIIDLYNKDPYTFIKAVASNPDEGMNVLYIFRNKAVFPDANATKDSLLNGIEDGDTRVMIESFFKYYDSICST